MELLSALLGAVMTTAIACLGAAALRAWDNDTFSPALPRLPWEDKGWLCILLLSVGMWIATALLWVRSVPTTVLDVLFLAGMTLLCQIDRKLHIVPNRLLLVMLGAWLTVCAVTVLFATETGLALVFSGIGGALIAGAVFFLCYLISGRQLGGGDVKLSLIMGLYLTTGRIMGAITYGVILCCIYTVVMLILKKISLKDGIPLVPFLYLGVLLVMLVVG